MPFKVEKPYINHVALNLPTDIDPDQDTYAEFAQATQAEIEKLASLNAEASRIFREGSKEVEVKQKWNSAEQKRMQVALTLAGTNMINEKGESLFIFKNDGNRLRVSDEVNFKRAWGTLPPAVIDALYAACLDSNPQWDTRTGEGE